MSIRKRLASFMMLMVGLLFIMGSLLLVGGPLIVEAFRNSLESMNSLDAIRDLRSHIARQRTSFNQYILLNDPQELLGFEEASRLSEKSLIAIRTKSSHVPAWYTELEELCAEARAAARDVTLHYKQGRKARAIDDATSTVFPKFQKLFDRVNTLERDKSAEAQAMFQKIKSLMDFLQVAVVTALLLAFVLGVVLFSLLYRAVMKPLETLKKGADEFGQGHWDNRINLPSANEFGVLAESFNTMAENVKQLQMQAVHMDRMSAVGQLAGGVAHEINNPLTAVLGQAQILLAKLKDSDPSYLHIQKIEQAALRCKKIVRGLLDFSRPSQSTFEEIDVNAIVTATLDLCEADLKRGRVTVEKRLTKTLPLIAGNSSELQQVFLNLISNAIHAMPRGGTLTFENRTFNDALTIFDRRKGQPPRKVQGSWIEIAIHDTGAGITKDHLPRIFEPFFTTKEIGKGTGLGLAVSMGIVQKHGGDLRVESPGLNHGATFYLTLPVHRGSSQRAGMAA